MKYYFPFTLLYFLLISCSDNDDNSIAVCGVNNPSEELAWLKAKIDMEKNHREELFVYFYVTQATYRNQTIFLFDYCCPLCDTVVSVYDCSGEFLGQIGNGIDGENIKARQIVFQPEGFECELNF